MSKAYTFMGLVIVTIYTIPFSQLLTPNSTEILKKRFMQPCNEPEQGTGLTNAYFFFQEKQDLEQADGEWGDCLS